MTTIDLDLVELRAKARGWRVERVREYLGGHQYVDHVSVYTPQGRIWADETGEWGNDAVASEPHEHIIAAPRWTLDRLLSEPPEGWVYEARYERLMWRSDPGEPSLSVTWEHGGKWLGWEWHFDVATDCYTERLPAFARQAQAAAELALILAEVEP